MALEKIERKTILQRIRILILGKEKPNLLTRASVISGFIIWLYLMSSQLLTLLSIVLLDKLDNSPRIRASYSGVGNSYYGYTDTINRLFFHSLSEILVYLVMLVALVLIWRKKKIGLILYVAGNAGILFVTFLIMGWKYMAREIAIFDYILIISSALYFLLGLFLFYRKKED